MSRTGSRKAALAAVASPDVPRRYLELFVRAATSSNKPHYLLHTRPGVMNREQVAYLRTEGIPVVGGIREGLTAIERLARDATEETFSDPVFRGNPTRET